MLFEQASRNKLTFNTDKGLLTIYDLWDLPLTSNRGSVNLDDLARGLSRDLKASSEESFVNKPTKASEGLQLALDVVKRVIEVRLAENEAASMKRVAAEKKARLQEIVARKKDEVLEGRPLEELEAELAAL